MLSRLRSLVSVNSAIEVDLLGQVGAELRNCVHIGAVGGRSTSADVDAVVTEHGVAALAGCTVAERARRLVAVAAPHHREELASSLARQ